MPRQAGEDAYLNGHERKCLTWVAASQSRSQTLDGFKYVSFVNPSLGVGSMSKLPLLPHSGGNHRRVQPRRLYSRGFNSDGGDRGQMISSRWDPEGPTAAEIVGGHGMRRERPVCRRERPRRQYREAALERAVLDMFAGAGQFAVNQVYCGVAGRADVVTAYCIYELKDRLTRRSFYHAYGQLHGYRRHINPGKNIAIICNETNLSESMLREFEDIWGVPILVWGNPPYTIPTRLQGEA